MVEDKEQQRLLLVKQRADWIEQGWKRGAFVDLKKRPDLVEELPRKLREHILQLEEAYLFPTLYDCALINPNPDAEPWAQCLICWPCNTDQSYIHAKDPRKYHFSLILSGEEKSMEVTALSFCQLEKEILMREPPIGDVEWCQHGLEIMLNWVTNRYDQPTFPDAFNRKMEKIKSNLKSLSRNPDFNKYCSGIYINLEPFEEIAPQQIYTIKVFVTFPEMDGRTLKEFNKTVGPNLTSRLRTIFKKLEKQEITVLNIDTIPEGEFTKAEERDYKRWSLENFTYEIDGLDAPLPAEKEFQR